MPAARPCLGPMWITSQAGLNPLAPPLTTPAVATTLEALGVIRIGAELAGEFRGDAETSEAELREIADDERAPYMKRAA